MSEEPIGGTDARTSRLAIASVTLGLLSLLLVCFAGVPAVILGIVALKQIHRDSTRLRGRQLAMAGIVIGGATSVVGCLVKLELLTVSHAREPAYRSQCKNRLRNVALALHNYHDANRSFPPSRFVGGDGIPQHSWRASILSLHLDGPTGGTGYRFDEPWYGPNNRRLSGATPEYYSCGWDKDETSTDYLLLTGGTSVFRTQDYAPRLSEIYDRENTIMLVESHGTGIAWTEPRDLDVRTMPARINAPGGISSRHPGGANVALADGSVRYLSDSLDAGVLASMISGQRQVPHQ